MSAQHGTGWIRLTVGLSFVLALALAQNASAVAAGGGTMTTYDAGGTNYTVHTFTNSGTFDVISP